MSTAREHLAARQAELARALLAGDAVPAGFDADRVRAEARSLHLKRRSVAAKVRPDLVEALGDEFHPLFDTWAGDHPRPAGVSFRADLDTFAAWLRDNGHLPEATKRRSRWHRGLFSRS